MSPCVEGQMTKDRDDVMVRRMKQGIIDENDGDDDYFQSYFSFFTTPIIHHSCIPVCQLIDNNYQDDLD